MVAAGCAIFLQTARANLMYGCSDKIRHLTGDVAISCQLSKFINALHFVKQWVIDQSRTRPSLRTQPGVKAIYSVLAATSFNCFGQKGESLRVGGLSHVGFVCGAVPEKRTSKSSQDFYVVKHPCWPALEKS